MKADIILTTADESGNLIEIIIGHTNVTLNTDYRKLIDGLGTKYLGAKHNHVRPDPALFGFTAVANDGDTIHLQ
jgi:hypothetical protein